MPRMTIDVPASVHSRIRAFAASRADEDSGPMSDSQALMFLAEYALNRQAALAKHKAKVAAAKAGATDVRFLRYTPTVPAPEYAANVNEPAVVAWAAEAPSRGA